MGELTAWKGNGPIDSLGFDDDESLPDPLATGYRHP